MDYDEEDGGAFGNFPESGAIFMSNMETKKECLKRKIFALPYSHAEFVAHVKAGMFLFLFEFRKRQLFGVFQATTDGAVDILPHAFNYSGKRYPAQVRVRQLWHCDPLPEREFRDAIRENYYYANQFNFGLSRDQVQKLLNLFSSRKMKNKILPHPRSEAIVEMDVKDRRWVGSDRHELHERRCMIAAEYDEMNNVALSDHHVSSLARGREDEVLVDDRVNAEGKLYYFPQDDFLAKRRRIGIEGRLTTNNVAENGLYSHSHRRTFRSDSPKDSSDEVRRLANSAHHDYRFMLKSISSDDYNTHDGHQRAFASDHCGGSLGNLGKRKHVINDVRLLLDDKRDFNVNEVKSRANTTNDNLNLDRQARDIVEDHEWLMNRKLETRDHLDCDGSIISTFGRSLRETAAGRFQVDESEPDSVEDFASETILRPPQCGYKNYPTLDGRSTENMVDKFPPVLATTAGYIANVDRQTVNGRFRRSEDPDNSHRHANPVFDDATITRVLPYDHPDLYSNMSQQYTLEPEKSRRPLDMALELGNIDLPRSTSGVQSSFLQESTNSFMNPNSFVDMVLDTSAPVNYRGPSSLKLSPPFTDLENFEGEKGMSAYYSKSRDNCFTFQRNLRGASEDLGADVFQPETDVAVYENQQFRLSRDRNLKELHRTSEAKSTLNRKSVFARLSSKSTWLGEDRNVIDVHPQDCYMDATADELMAMVTQDNNLSWQKLKKSRVLGQPRENAVNEKKIQCNMETDYSTLEKRRLKFACQTTLPREYAVDGKKTQCTMEADHSKMEKRRLKFASQTNSPREDAVDGKKIQRTMETEQAIIEKRRLKFASQNTADNIDEIPIETRTLDFKRRCDRKRNLVGTGAELASRSKLTGANEEVKSSTDLTFRRKKLVRPVFTKTDSNIDAPRCKETLLVPSLNLDKDDKESCQTAISLHESEIPNYIVESSNVLASHTCQEIDCNNELQKDKEAYVLPSTNAYLNGHGQANDHISEVLKETSKQTSLDILTSGEGVLSKVTDTAIKETSYQKSVDVQKSVEGVLAEVIVTTIKEPSQMKSLDIQTSPEGVLVELADTTSIKESSQRKSLDAQSSGEGILAKGSDISTKEAPQQKSFGTQTSVECILATVADASIKEPSQQKNFGIQTSTEGVLAGVAETSIKQISLDIQTSGEGILVEDTYSAVKETSKKKSLDTQKSVEGVLAEFPDPTINEVYIPQKNFDIQTSVEGILAKDTDTTVKEKTSQPKSLDVQTSSGTSTTNLNLPESSLEGFKLADCCRNNLSQEKHLKKMKIILTSKIDAKASSQ